MSSIDRLRDRWRRRDKRGSLVPLGIAAAIVMLAIVVVLPQQDAGESDYRTLYDERPAVPILVSISSGVSSAEAQQLFEDLSLQAERQANGLYRVALPPDTSVSDLYGILQKLRDDGRVADAEALTEGD